MAWHRTWNDPPPGRRGGLLADRGGWMPPAVKLILIATVAVFLLEIWNRDLVFGLGALTVRGLLRLQVWRLATYMFLHASGDHILINMFMFVMLGVALERQIGSRPFLALYFAAGAAGGLCEVVFNLLMYLRYGAAPLNVLGHTFLDIPAVGASAGVAGVLVAFAVLNPRAVFLVMFLIPVEARWIALVYALIETRHVVLGLTRGWTNNVANAAHLGGMVLGFVWMRYGPRLAAAWRGRARPAAPEYFARGSDEDRAEEDRILHKIHEQGMDSLTLRERMFLQEMSRKYRDRP